MEQHIANAPVVPAVNEALFYELDIFNSNPQTSPPGKVLLSAALYRGRDRAQKGKLSSQGHTVSKQQAYGSNASTLRFRIFEPLPYRPLVCCKFSAGPVALAGLASTSSWGRTCLEDKA